MNSSSLFNSRSEQPALNLISLATMSPEQARKHLRDILIVNPNYFGKLTNNAFKAVLRIQQDTTYESIGYVGYSPSLENLQATIHLSKSNGYSRENRASKEYVRFYLSYDHGLSWFDQGLSSFTVQDELGPAPRQLTLWVGISPALTLCFLDRLPHVRTILSWNTPPPEDSPEWVPMWGDVLNAQISLGNAEEALSDKSGRDDISNFEIGCSSFGPNAQTFTNLF